MEAGWKGQRAWKGRNIALQEMNHPPAGLLYLDGGRAEKIEHESLVLTAQRLCLPSQELWVSTYV
jgi:hypothetical protein